MYIVLWIIVILEGLAIIFLVANMLALLKRQMQHQLWIELFNGILAHPDFPDITPEAKAELLLQFSELVSD
jgi:hypothetical protein